ncbi:AAA family ATPase [Candidatus Collierbacteria bacterium CG10_big_fil_rev_8_21_14_0_10_44_9]|uniref:AAA family ATPase n=1 Tax=Candidatus Collierbacteria bacterium CG10_big_fil_rev_8_21_14_0_10_44_9 TaxID=1974535 RepID=A0A2H0VJK3_9BACT|nr:MAG: AAA family ATPase [Candidatus Collierbacteria bacterium CG10_big_fil_rev_8_21_14_0_10_44_9]
MQSQNQKNSVRQSLTDSLRPTSLDLYIGQTHLVGPGAPLRRAIETGTLHSMILWGPPGCGKTTLAKIIATSIDADLHYLSAVSSKKEDIKKIIESKSLKHTILFLDEIHRFSKAQQDYLLPYVESGVLTLIGATTENPSFEVIGPLQSRCQIYVLKGLTEDDLKQIITQGAKKLKVKVAKDASEFLATYSNGDGRKALNVLETVGSLYKKITLNNIKTTLQSPYLRYDQAGDEHYDTISAFIKSMRASQIDAAMYYLARMVESGEDPLFIARRMVIFASEDIGLAVPTALVVANAVFRACETTGYPECQLNLAHGVAYLCGCKKSRVANDAFFAALEDVKTHGNLPIPLKIRNAPTKLMKDLSYGKSYTKYDADSYLPDKLKNKKYLRT